MAWTPYIDSDTQARNGALALANQHLLDIFTELRDIGRDTNLQLRLLNARTEHMGDTRIGINDIERE